MDENEELARLHATAGNTGVVYALLAPNATLQEVAVVLGKGVDELHQLRRIQGGRV